MENELIRCMAYLTSDETTDDAMERMTRSVAEYLIGQARAARAFRKRTSGMTFQFAVLIVEDPPASTLPIAI